MLSLENVYIHALSYKDHKSFQVHTNNTSELSTNNQRSDDVILAIQVEKSDDQEANLPHTFDFNDSDGAIEERFELGCRSYYFSRTNRIAKR